MADTAVAITAGTGTNIDTRTEGTNGNHRQVVVIGDPATNAGVAPVDATNGLSVNVTNASLTVASHAVTNAGTFATQPAGSVAHDAVGTSVNPVLAGGYASAAAPTDVSADGDSVRAWHLRNGAQAVVVTAAGALIGATSNALDVNIKSGVNANGQATMANSAPTVIASDQSAIKTTPTASATGNTLTASRINAAASTNATNLKASAGQISSIDVYNPAAYAVFLKIYNKASSPTVGTDTPVMTIPVSAGGGYSKTWTFGFPLGTGISYAITKLQADSDTTVVVAGDLTGNILWV